MKSAYVNNLRAIRLMDGSGGASMASAPMEKPSLMGLALETTPYFYFTNSGEITCIG